MTLPEWDRLREHAELSAAPLCRAAGFSLARLSQARGGRTMPPDKLAALWAALRAEIDRRATLYTGLS